MCVCVCSNKIDNHNREKTLLENEEEEEKKDIIHLVFVIIFVSFYTLRINKANIVFCFAFQMENEIHMGKQN